VALHKFKGRQPASERTKGTGKQDDDQSRPIIGWLELRCVCVCVLAGVAATQRNLELARIVLEVAMHSIVWDEK